MKKFLLTFVIVFISMYCFSQNKEKSDSENIAFDFVYYEYGQPLQKNDTDFDIRRYYKVFDDRNAIVVDKQYKGYKIYNIEIPKNLFKKILNLSEKLKDSRIKDKMEKGVHYADAYYFFRIKNKNDYNSICFITPLVTNELNEAWRKLFEIRLEKGRLYEKDDKNFSLSIENYKDLIVPIHIKSNLPLIELPPPIKL